MRILVTGGTGVIGKPVIDRLIQRGHSVRLLSRNAERDAGLWPERVEPYSGSVSDAGLVRGAAEGCDAVLHIAGIVAEEPPAVTFQEVNVEGTRRLLEEAQRAGAARFVYVSSLGASHGASDYHCSKREAEELVRGFQGSWLVLRPGKVYGPGDDVISTLLAMVRTLPAIPTVGWGKQPFQPIWMDDLAQCLVAAAEAEEPAGVTLELAGSEVTTTAEVLEILGEITGRSPPRLPLPASVIGAGSSLAESLGFQPGINDDVLTMLAEENVIEGEENALVTVFNVSPTPLRDGLRRLADELPERLPSEGVGPLYRHRYWADIRGGRLDADALFTLVCDHFGELAPEPLLEVDAEGRGEVALRPGATLTLSVPLRGTIQVRVEEVRDRAATSVTLAGHPLSGMIRFLVRELTAHDGGPQPLRFEVRSYFRGSNVADRAVMATVGRPLQETTWRSLVEAVVQRSGGEAVEGVQTSHGRLSEDEAEHVERWVEGLVMRRQREEADQRA
ncbi:MAG TPA: NAD-dependent epimerase/dehydratase family protein [Longimicrobiaceae bacterium]